MAKDSALQASRLWISNVAQGFGAIQKPEDHPTIQIIDKALSNPPSEMRKFTDQKCLHCENHVWNKDVHICRTCDSARLQNRIASLEKALGDCREAADKVTQKP